MYFCVLKTKSTSQALIKLKILQTLGRNPTRNRPKKLGPTYNSGSLNLLLVRSDQATIIIVKRLIQRRNNLTRVRVEPRSCDQLRRRNDAFTISAKLPTKIMKIIKASFCNDLDCVIGFNSNPGQWS